MWSSYSNLRLFYSSDPWFWFNDVDTIQIKLLFYVWYYIFLLKIVVPESWIASNLMNCQWHGSDCSTIIQHSYNHLEMLRNASQWWSVPRNTLPATVTSPGLRPAAGSKQSEARRGLNISASSQPRCRKYWNVCFNAGNMKWVHLSG